MLAMPGTIDHRDAATARQLQQMLLPPGEIALHGWEAAHVYQPAGLVGGDYIDLVPHRDGVYFMVGDVSGKGVAAALVVAQMHAMFRTLISVGSSLHEIMTRASALLCASSLPTQYATIVCGHLDESGRVEIVNAGHPPPLVVSAGAHASVRPTGVPIGLFCESAFSSTTLTLSGSETLLVYTDGLSEARDAADEEYGVQRIEAAALSGAGAARLQDVVAGILTNHDQFRGGVPVEDDLTVLALRRSAAGTPDATSDARRAACPAGSAVH
jgi:sigma-B regulation protein RsbU (phosphoserine phosphatase)